MSPKPTTVIVHGAWHQPAHFAPFMQKLEAAGYPCICPQQLTFGLSSEQMKTGPTLQDDAKQLQSVLKQLIEVEEREVVVLMHSYGGVVGTEGVHASLGAKRRREQGKKGGVVKMVFMCAFVLPPGWSLRDAFGEDVPEFLQFEEDGSCTLKDPGSIFYSNLDAETANYWLSLTKPHPERAQLAKLTYTAYQHHPLAYLVCTEDVGLSAEAQRGMIAACNAQGLDVDVYELEADHSPWLSREAETMEVLKRIADRASQWTPASVSMTPVMARM